MTTLQAIILAIIEGITEFLPVSSTGHMIIASSLMGIPSSEYVKMFTVAIQFGAILSVVALYYKRFFQSFDFYIKLLVAFVPAAVAGFLLNDVIDSLLESPLCVAISLVVGGVVLIFADRWFTQPTRTEIDLPTAFKIGLFQVIAMIPGVSRSGATMIGGLAQKLSKQNAAEFSFFLAVPTMFAATCYKMYKYHKTVGFDTSHSTDLIIGNTVAFVVAFVAIRGFVGYVTKNGFKIFGYYRIIVGLTIIALYLLNIPLQIL
jgi:undecaprenyl-diphosphatase